MYKVKKLGHKTTKSYYQIQLLCATQSRGKQSKTGPHRTEHSKAEHSQRGINKNRFWCRSMVISKQVALIGASARLCAIKKT